ncbi:hypothetical protein [Nonomuraea sp. NPDC048826]|uniref:hypothetical protein n=1 Tax=Nonomuraea sp. NPDC048826 TaxID=3364347 RepID=UPI003719010F
MRSQEDLIRTLRTAAEHAEPAPTLAAAVAARRRARRRGQRLRVALAAAAAVVLVAGGTTAVLSDRDEQARPAVTRSAEPVAVPVAEVWPEAVFTMPGTAVDGRDYLPITALGPTEILVGAPAPAGGLDRLEAFDTGTRTFRTIGDMPKPKVPGYGFRDVKAGEKHIVWWGESPDAGDDAFANFWHVPRTGGETQHIAHLTGEFAQVDGFDIVGDHIVFSIEQGGVYRLPLTGGEPRKIDGTDGLHLTSWPLAAAYPTGEPHAQERTVDLETGRSVEASAPSGAQAFVCGSRWCAGTSDDGAFRQRLDGSDRRPLPAGLELLAFRGLLADRFVFGRLSSGTITTAVYDLDTGKFAGLSGGGSELGFGVPRPTVFHWGDRGELTVLNLLAVR